MTCYFHCKSCLIKSTISSRWCRELVLILYNLSSWSLLLSSMLDTPSWASFLMLSISVAKGFSFFLVLTVKVGAGESRTGWSRDQDVSLGRFDIFDYFFFQKNQFFSFLREKTATPVSFNILWINMYSTRSRNVHEGYARLDPERDSVTRDHFCVITEHVFRKFLAFS